MGEVVAFQVGTVACAEALRRSWLGSGASSVRSDGVSLRAFSTIGVLRGFLRGPALESREGFGPDSSLEGWRPWCAAGGCLKQEQVGPTCGRGKGKGRGWRNQGCSLRPGLGDSGLFPIRGTREAREASRETWGLSELQGDTAES